MSQAGGYAVIVRQLALRGLDRAFVLTAIAAELLIIGGTSLAAGFQPWARGLDVTAYMLLVVSAAAVPVALVWAVPAFVVALGATLAFYSLGYVHASPVFLTILVILFLAATPRRVARSVIMGLATFGAVLGSSLSGARLSATTFSAAAWIAAFILAGHAVSAQRAYLAAMRERARRAEETKDLEVRRSVAEERLRIARELHDVLSHTISVINVQAGVAAHVLDKRPEQARPALEAITEASRQALSELRGILRVLRAADESEPYQPTPGLADVQGLLEQTRKAGLCVTLAAATAGDGLPPAVQLAAYRIVQESLTNAMRHAPGASAEVQLHRQNGRLIVAVTNTQGNVKLEQYGAGQGIIGMRERAASVGGTLEAGARPDGGFRVHASLPVNP